MADRKISDLTALTAPASGDYLPIVDISEAAAANKNKRITIEELFRGVPLGTAAAPSIAIEGDENTGIYSPGADQLAISTNGTGRLFVDASGNVGIGVAPSAPLSFAGSTGRKVGFYQGTEGYSIGVESSEFRFVTDAGGAFTFRNGSTYSSATEYARIHSSGRFGIGTSAPDTILHLSNGNPIFLIQETDQAANSQRWGIQSEASILKFRAFNDAMSSAVDALSLTRSGSVGIGTTSPGGKLVVSDGSTTFQFDPVGGTGNVLRSLTTAGARDSLLFDASQLVYSNSGSERFRCDTSGRLLVGTSSTSATVTSLLQGNSGGTSNAGILHLAVGATTPADGSNCGRIHFSDSNHTTAASIAAQRDGGTWTSNTSMPTRLVFSTTEDGASSPTERMRISSAGNLLFGQSTTTTPGDGNTTVGSVLQGAGKLYVSGGTARALTLNRNDDGAVSGFFSSGTQVGSISVTATATAYNTSSDYRLKENVTAVTDGITRLQQLKPSRFNFITDPDKTVDGFIAHEVQDIVPEAITGEKDAVDDDGNPIYQGIDQSKLVPLLTAALQEAIAKIESLEARLTAAGI